MTLGLLVGLLGLSVAAHAARGPGPAGGGLTQTAAGLPDLARVALPASCTPTPNPPPTQYGFVARTEGGSLDGGDLGLDDVDVSICGVLQVVNARDTGCEGVQAELRIASDGLVVNGLSARYTPVPDSTLDVPTDLRTKPIRQLLPCQDSEEGIEMDLTIDLEGRIGAFALRCDIPTTGTLSGTVKGPLLTPPFEGRATFTGELRLGRVANNDKFCPGRLPQRIDRLLKLPLRGNQTELPTRLSVYHPG